MPRVKRSTKRRDRRRKVLGLAKGYFGAKSRNYRTAKEAVEKSLLYAYRDRRAKKTGFPQPVDRPDQGRRPCQRDLLQPLHPRPEGPRHRPGPEDPGRPGRQRPRDVRVSGPQGQRNRGLAPGHGDPQGPGRRSPQSVRGGGPQGRRREVPRGAAEPLPEPQEGPRHPSVRGPQVRSRRGQARGGPGWSTSSRHFVQDRLAAVEAPDQGAGEQYPASRRHSAGPDPARPEEVRRDAPPARPLPAGDRGRSSCAWASPSRRGRRSRPTTTTSRPSTSRPTTRPATPGTRSTSRTTSSSGRTRRPSRSGSWRSRSRPSASSSPAGSSAGRRPTRPTCRCSCRSRAWSSTRASPSPTSRGRSSTSSGPSSARRSRSASGRASSPSPSPRPRSTSSASSARAGTRPAASAAGRAGRRSWARAWSIPRSSRTSTSTRRNTPAGPSAWASTGRPCSPSASRTCGISTRTT